MKTLLIDHDDSFTQNLKHWLKPLFQEIVVINHLQLHEKLNWNILKKQFDLFVLSPGPKSPEDYPHSLDMLASIENDAAVFGVCLGLQMMAVSCGLQVSTYSPPLHGKTSKIRALESKVQSFDGLAVARYHSIKVNGSSSEFHLLAESEDDHQPMWFQHQTKKWMAVQFHPESFLTEAPEKHLHFLRDWLQGKV